MPLSYLDYWSSVHVFAGFFDKQIVTFNIASDVTTVKCLQTGAAA